MKRASRSLAAVVFGFAITLVAFGVSAKVSGQPSGTYLGKLDFPKYCEMAWGADAGAYTDGPDARSWRCATRPNGIFTPREIVMDVACATLYGGPTDARTYDPTWRFSWECYRA